MEILMDGTFLRADAALILGTGTILFHYNYTVFFPRGQEGTFLNGGFTGAVAKKGRAWYDF